MKCRKSLPVKAFYVTIVLVLLYSAMVAEAQSGNIAKKEAQTLLSKGQPKHPPLVLEPETSIIKSSKLAALDRSESELVGVEPPRSFQATAYSLRGITRSGSYVRRGVIAADPRVLPLGSVVHLKAGNYTGVYSVQDTGRAIKGKRIDVWMPSAKETRKFGRRQVKLTILTYGPESSRPDLSKLRRWLETAHSLYQMSFAEYTKKEKELSVYEDAIFAKATKLIGNDPAIFAKAIYASDLFDHNQVITRSYTDLWLKAFLERLKLEIELKNKTISESEYAERKQNLIRTERGLGQQCPLSYEDVSKYYEGISEVKSILMKPEYTMQTQEPMAVKISHYVTASIQLLVGLLVFVSTMFIGIANYSVNKKKAEQEYKESDARLAQMDAKKDLEIHELRLKVSQIEDMKELQMRELQLKIKQLEQQLTVQPANLIIAQ